MPPAVMPLLKVAGGRLKTAKLPFQPASAGAEEFRQYYADPNSPRSVDRLGVIYATELYSQHPQFGVRNPRSFRLNAGEGNLIGTTLAQQSPLVGAFNRGSVSEGDGNQIYIDLGDVAGLVQAASGSVRHNGGSDGQYGLAGGVGIQNGGRISMGSGIDDRVVAFAGVTGLLNTGLIHSNGSAGDGLLVWGAGGRVGVDQRGRLISRNNSADQLIASALQANAEATELQLTGLSFLPGYGSFIDAMRDGLASMHQADADVVGLINRKNGRIDLNGGADQLLAAAPAGGLAVRNDGQIDLGSGADVCTIQGSFAGDGLIDFGSGQRDRLELLPDANYKLSRPSKGLQQFYGTEDLLYLEGVDSVVTGSLFMAHLEFIGDRSVDSILAMGGEFTF